MPSRFGIYDDLPPYLSMSLGAGETTLMRMTTAYAMLANGGKRIKATLIDRIQDRWGHTIYRHDERICQNCNAAEWDNQAEPTIIDKREQVIDPMTAYQITSIMEGVIQRGTGQAIRAVGKHLAGKTGTTNDAKDLWFVGYSPDLAVGVFMGYDRPRSLGDSAQAALYTAPIFRDFMEVALKDKPDVPFRVPPGIKLISVDPKTGLRSTGAGHDPGSLQARHRTADDVHLRHADADGDDRRSQRRPESGAGYGRPLLIQARGTHLHRETALPIFRRLIQRSFSSSCVPKPNRSLNRSSNPWDC